MIWRLICETFLFKYKIYQVQDLSEAQKYKGQSTPRIDFKFEHILKFPVMWELEFCADWKIEVWSASVYEVNFYVCVCLYKSSACLQVGVYMLTACVAAHRKWPWHPASASVYPKTYSVIWSSENKWGVIHKVGEMVLFTFQREDGVCAFLKSIG